MTETVEKKERQFAMKYDVILGSSISIENIKEILKTAHKIEKVYITGEHLLYKTLFKVQSVEISKLKQVYVRIEGGESGDFLVEDSFLVMIALDDKEYTWHMGHPANVKAVVQYIEEHYDGIICGK